MAGFNLDPSFTLNQSCRRMDATCFGAFILILSELHSVGGRLSCSLDDLMVIGRLGAAERKRCQTKLAAELFLEGQTWSHPEVDRQLLAARRVSSARSKASAARWGEDHVSPRKDSRLSRFKSDANAMQMHGVEHEITGNSIVFPVSQVETQSKCIAFASENENPTFPNSLSQFPIENSSGTPPKSHPPKEKLTKENPPSLSPPSQSKPVKGYSEQFESFWSAYRALGGDTVLPKQKTWEAWQKVVKRVDPVEVLAGLGRYAAYLNAAEPVAIANRKRSPREFVPMPTTWLNQTRWEQEYPSAYSVSVQVVPKLNTDFWMEVGYQLDSGEVISVEQFQAIPLKERPTYRITNTRRAMVGGERVRALFDEDAWYRDRGIVREV